MTITFDALDYARKLESAGVPIAQAEQQSKLLADVLGKSVASQNDLTTIEYNLTSKIDKLDIKLSGEIALVRSEINLVKWMLGTLMAISIAVVFKLFLH